MEKLNAIDTEVFYWVNRHHCTVSDYVLWTFSQAWSWALVLIAVFVFVTLRKEKKMWWVVLLGMALCFLFSDRISVLCFKDVFQRLRPCHALPDVRMILGTTCGGAYGFVSSHAANCFSLTMFLSLWYGNRYKPLPYMLFAWALTVGYSRPYLGKHYPGDVICGAVLGILIGWIVYLLIRWISGKIKYRKNEA